MRKNEKLTSRRDLEFLFEIGSLRNVQRLWRQHFGMDVANDLEHTIRVVWLALIIARMEKIVDEEKVLKMALIHDIAETRTSDHAHVHKSYVRSDERRAAHDIFSGTTVQDFEKLLNEYRSRESHEAKIVKDADNLDVDFELRELAEKGSKLPEKWIPGRRTIRDKKLYTKSAKKTWDLLQKSDSASWHISANKWLQSPRAGR